MGLGEIKIFTKSTKNFSLVVQPFFFLSQPKWPKLQFSAYLVICIMGWVGFFSAIIKSGWHVKSQIRRSSLVSKYIVFWLKKGCGVLGLFCISIVHSLV